MSLVYLPEERVRAIGAVLQSARERRGESHADVAFRIALSPSQLRAIEAGDLRPFYSPSYFLQAAERYANALDVSLPAPPAIPDPVPKVQPDVLTDIQSESQAAVKPAPKPKTNSAPLSELQTKPAEITEQKLVNSLSAPVATTAATSVMTAVENPTPRVMPITKNTSAAPAQPETFSHSPEPLAAASANEGSGSPVSPSRSTPLGWIVLVAALVIVIGVAKISFQKSGPSPVKEEIIQAPPSEPKPETEKLAAPSPAESVAPVSTRTVAPLASTPVQSATPIQQPAQPAKPAQPVPVLSDGMDSVLVSQTSTWVQIVKLTGEKQNLNITPGQKIEFNADKTAAIVFGKPDQASLKVKGRPINLSQFVTNDTPPRALVILRQLKD